MSNKKTRDMVLCAIFSALIIVMTVVPYTGYINYGGPAEITTLHIVVALGAALLGWKYGAVLGGVWGATCIARAFTNPAWILFTNPLISLLPRVLVGMAAGAVFALARKLKLSAIPSAVLAAVFATLTNTVLVISAIYIFGDMIDSYKAMYAIFKDILAALTAFNGSLELGGAVIIVPALYAAISRSDRRLGGES